MVFSNPLLPVNALDDLSAKSLPPTRSFCALAADNLVVTALKKAERDDAIVLRVVEMDGVRAETPVEILGAKRSFRTVNLLEEGTGPGDQQALQVKPYEISTVRLPLKQGVQTEVTSPTDQR
jgi:alpha-mannosidase